MAVDKFIGDLTPQTTPSPSDLLETEQVSDTTSKKVTIQQAVDAASVHNPVLSAKGSILAASAAHTPVDLTAGSDYWSPSYLAANANGIVRSPSRTLLKTAGYLKVINDLTETTLITLSLPANTMGLIGSIWYEVWMDVLNNKGSDGVIDVKMYFGTSTMTNNFTNQRTWASGTNRGSFQANALLASVNSATVQRGIMIAASYEHTSTQNGPQMMAPASFTEDTTQALTVKITAKMDAANAAFEFTLQYAAIGVNGIGIGA